MAGACPSATAIVNVKEAKNNFHSVKVLLDRASQPNFILSLFAKN